MNLKHVDLATNTPQANQTSTKPSLIAFILLAAAGTASAACAGTTLTATTTIINMLITIGYPIGVFMIAYMGVKWIVAEGPEDRENARRGIIYVVIGLLLLRTANKLVEYLLC